MEMCIRDRVMDMLLGFIEKRMNKRSIKDKKVNKVMALVSIGLCIVIVIGTVVSRKKQDIIHIATKPMTEQYVLGLSLIHI